MTETTAKNLVAYTSDPAQAQSDAEILARCNTALKAAKSVRVKYEAQWLQNFGFYAGNQYEAYYSDTRQYLNTRRLEIAAPSTKVKLVCNKILPMCSQQAAYIRANFPEEVALAPNLDPEWQKRAEIATDVLKARHYVDDEETQRFYDLLWVFGGGRIWVIVYWDTDAPYKGFDGVDVYGVGDERRRSLNPFMTFQSPWVDSTGEMPWVIIADVLPVDQINAAYDLKGDEQIKAENMQDDLGGVDSLLQSVVQGTQRPTKRENAAIHYTMVHRPTAAYPHGKRFCFTQSKLLARPDELPERKWMLTPLDWTPAPGANYPIPYIQPMISAQKEYNFSLSQIREAANRKLRGDYKYVGNAPPSEEQANIQLDYDKETGAKMYRIRPGVEEFEFINYNLLSPEDTKYMALEMREAVLDAGSIHDQSLGKQTSADQRVGTTMALIQSDMTGSSLHRDFLAAAYCKIGQNKLHCIASHLQTERQMRYVGHDNQPRQQIVSGFEIQGIDDVRVIETPMMTDAQRRQVLETLAGEVKAFGPYLGDPGTLAYYEAMQAGVIQALLTGIPEAKRLAEEAIAPFSIEGLRQFIGEMRKQAVDLILNPPQPEPVMPGAMGGGAPPMPMGGGMPVQIPQAANPAMP